MLTPQQQSNPQEDYLTIKSIDPNPLGLPTDSSPFTPSAALKVVQIGYSPKFSYPPKRSIIHDVNCFTKRRNKDSLKAPEDSLNRSYHDQNSQKSRAWAKVTREWGASRSGQNLEVLIPSPREQLDSLKTGLKSAREQNDEYLRQNNNIVKQKIRSKMLGEKRQPFYDARPTNARMDRFGKYNHALQQFMIRKKINKRRHQTIPDEASEQSSDTIHLHPQQDTSESSSVLLSVKRKGTLSLFRNLTLAHENLPREPKLIIVSRLNPTTHRSVKLASQYQQNKSVSKRQSGVSLLKRFICKNFPKASQSVQKSSIASPEKSTLEQLMGDGSLSKLTINQKPAPSHFIKLPFNCTLLKRQIKQLRKESVELPQLLASIESEQIQKQQASLDAKINSKKFSTLFDPQSNKTQGNGPIQPEENSLPKKYVVYSKKNLHSTPSPQ